jgi:hypothetical protein
MTTRAFFGFMVFFTTFVAGMVCLLSAATGGCL